MRKQRSNSSFTRTIHFQDKSKGLGKDKVSSFFLTCNSQSRDLISEALMKEVAQRFFEKIEDYLRFLDKDPRRNNNSYIDDVDIQSAVETGKKEKRVHLHALIRIEHRTKLQLDLRKITSYFERELRLKSVYLHVDFVPDNSISLLKYLRKPA